MTFSYSDPTIHVRDAVRFLVGDTSAEEHFLEDGEIDWLITVWRDKGTVYYPASMAAEAIAAKLTREVAISSDGQSVSLDALQDKYLTLAATLREQHKDLLAGDAVLHVGGMGASEKSYPDVAPLAFGTRMHDHREAGRQDYGDVDTIDWYTGQWGEFTP